MSVVQALLCRALGVVPPASFQASVEQERPQHFRRTRTPQKLGGLPGGITAVGVDDVEHRYVVAGDSRGNITLCDFEGRPRRRAGDPAGGSTQHQAKGRQLFKSKHGAAHRGMVSSAAWYPVDTGLFLTSGLDSRLLMWDTATTTIAEEVSWSEKIYCAVPSPAVSKHSLVAVGSSDPRVRLYDMASGAHAHTLVGHRHSVTAACWSPVTTNVLVTGSGDRTIRVWDVRKSGDAACLGTLDVHRGAHEEGSAGAGHTARAGYAHTGVVTSVHFVDGSDGRILVSSGADSFMRAWDVVDHVHKFTNFHDVVNTQSKGMTLASMSTGPAAEEALVFHPNSDGVVVACDLQTGATKAHLRGHYSCANACSVRRSTQQLVSGGDDGSVLVWTPRFPRRGPVRPEVAADSAWADDWEDVVVVE